MGRYQGKQIQACILLGGLGVRLKPLTNSIPKAMAPVVGDRPFLHLLIDYLRSQGLRRLLLLVGYKGSVIRNYFGSGSRFGVSIDYSEDPELLGTGGALRRAAPFLEDTFILVFGDTFARVNYGEFLEAGYETNCSLLMTVASRDAMGLPRGNVKVDEGDRVAAYRPRGGKECGHVDAGVLFIDKSVIRLLRVNEKSSLESTIYPYLIERGEVAAFIMDGRFYDIGTVEGLRMFKRHNAQIGRPDSRDML